MKKLLSFRQPSNIPGTTWASVINALFKHCYSQSSGYVCLTRDIPKPKSKRSFWLFPVRFCWVWILPSVQPYLQPLFSSCHLALVVSFPFFQSFGFVVDINYRYLFVVVVSLEVDIWYCVYFERSWKHEAQTFYVFSRATCNTNEGK